MIGYGELLLRAAARTGAEVTELSATSFFGNLGLTGQVGKQANNLDRFLITPVALAGRRTDIVHVADPGNAVYLPLVNHSLSVVTVHDMIPYLAEAGKLPGFRPTRLGRLLMRQIRRRLARADRVVCVSQATRRDVLELCDVDPARVIVIHNAVFQPMAPASAEGCRSSRYRYGLPPDAPIVLHVGRYSYKNRGAVLESTALLRRTRRDVHLVLVGELEPSLAAQAAGLSFGDALHVLPYVAREDMAALYTTASLLIFPSHYEGFGYPILEAQLCGTPVICSDRASLPEVAGEGAVVLPQDATALMATTMEMLLEDSEQRKKLVQQGYKNAARFPAGVWVRSQLELYHDLISTSASTNCESDLKDEHATEGAAAAADNQGPDFSSAGSC